MTSKYETRKGPGADLANRQLSELLNTWLTTQGPSPIFKTCASCRHMPIGNMPAFCELYKMVPPASVIISGCSSHDDSEDIPF